MAERQHSLNLEPLKSGASARDSYVYAQREIA